MFNQNPATNSLMSVIQHPPVFHQGEIRVQHRAGTRGVADELSVALSDHLPSIDAFNSLLSNLNIIWVSTVADNNVWVSPIFGSPSTFAQAISQQQLQIRHPRQLSADDLLLGSQTDGPVGFLAIDLERRRRYRVNGYATGSNTSSLVINVKESFPNCPKYIQRRTVTQQTGQLPPVPQSIKYETDSSLSSSDNHILSSADTLFIGTLNPRTGLDVNHRGGRPGYIRIVSPTEIFFPDYRGNGMFQSFGNLQVDKRAGITIIDFETGQLLQLSGTATVEWNRDNITAFTIEKAAERILRFYITHVRRSVGPVTNYRWQMLDYSPYNPTIPSANGETEKAATQYPMTVELVKISEESRNVKTFRFLAPTYIPFLPGQYATFEFENLPGLSEKHPVLVRTWTLSEAANSTVGDVTLEISVKRKVGGVMSNWLHDHAQIGLRVQLLGVGGEMVLSEKTSEIPPKLLFISGGIGITPNMAILRGIGARAQQFDSSSMDIVFMHQERHFEDFPFKNELFRRIKNAKGNAKLVLALSQDQELPIVEDHNAISTVSGRISKDLLKKYMSHITDRTVYLCGPLSFMDAMKIFLMELGVPSLQIITEEFNF